MSFGKRFLNVLQTGRSSLVLVVLAGFAVGIVSAVSIKDYRVYNAKLVVIAPARASTVSLIPNASDRLFEYVNNELKSLLSLKKFIKEVSTDAEGAKAVAQIDAEQLIRDLKVEMTTDFFEDRMANRGKNFPMELGFDTASIQVSYRVSNDLDIERGLELYIEFLNGVIASEFARLDRSAAKAQIEILNLEILDRKERIKRASEVREIVLLEAIEKAKKLKIDDPDFCNDSVRGSHKLSCYFEAIRIAALLGNDNFLFAGGVKYLEKELQTTREGEMAGHAIEREAILNTEKRISEIENLVRERRLEADGGKTHPSHAFTPMVIRYPITDLYVSSFQKRAFNIVLGGISGLCFAIALAFMRSLT